MANRVAFLVDGFNLYHSISDVSADCGTNCRWLDIVGLCSAFLPEISQDATNEAVYYFSAYARHAESWRPGTVARHSAYIAALQATGAVVSMSVFKAKQIKFRCPQCDKWHTETRHEEKETDVAIACKLVELAVGKSADSMVLVTGDTDVIPAIRTAKSLAKKPVYMLYPAGRRNNAFQRVADGGWRIKQKHCLLHQLPDPVAGPSGTLIHKPQQW